MEISRGTSKLALARLGLGIIGNVLPFQYQVSSTFPMQPKLGSEEEDRDRPSLAPWPSSYAENSVRMRTGRTGSRAALHLKAKWVILQSISHKRQIKQLLERSRWSLSSDNEEKRNYSSEQEIQSKGGKINRQDFSKLS